MLHRMNATTGVITAGFLFGRNGSNDQSFSAVTNNGWNVTGASHGDQVANTTFHNLPFDTDITVMGQGAGGTYEITFRVQESPSTITIQSFTFM